tara:strand:+ start:371 stop:619 length:249 start_codon:yes stop_codon:yes gene_type:complete
MSAKGSELKRVRQSRKANSRNRYYKSKMNTAIKKFLSLDKKQAKEDFPVIIKLIDQISSKGIIHKNKANNKKSKLSLYLNNK